MSQTAVSGDNRIDALLSTSQWGNSNGNSKNLTYSFPVSGSTWVSDYQGGEPFSPNSVSFLNATQQQYVRDVLQLWSNVANIGFAEVTEPGVQGDIRITYSTAVSGGTVGWAYDPPASSVTIAENGDVWLKPDLTDLSPNTQGFSTLIHELGHALGLKHPFATRSNNSALLSGQENTIQYSTMSYTDHEGVGWKQIGNTNRFTPTQNTTPMLYDVLAIQFLYGANTSFNTGNDVYTFSNTETELKTIWDAGGIDSFDLSNQSLNLIINLNAGQYSSVGVVNHELVNGTIQSTSRVASNNIAIAFNVEIENAIGGNGNDTITGNALANEITGGAGDDVISGGGGNDTATYAANRTEYTVQSVGNNLQISSLSSNEGVDIINGIELLKFADQVVDVSTLTTSGTIPTTPAEVNTTPMEGNSNHISYFLLQISNALSIDASVDYVTRDGTALAGQDYIATSGTSTIKAGKTSTVIGVEIIGDQLSENDETFLLAITNPQGGVFPRELTEITATRTIVDDDSGPSGNLMSEIQVVGVNHGLFSV